ncbi:MAG: GTP-binding protein [Candidatus Thermoplasmatota archaeon]|nr:GTP-binding protein [Candidatus Thermoplasmatota archaeon]
MDDDVVKRKVNLLGAPEVGKTSLIIRYVKNIFGDEYLKTIGTNVYTKTVPFEENKVKLVIQDIMGEVDFTSVQEGALKGSTGAIAVADITRTESLESLLNDWIPKYESISNEDNPVLLAVNKFDLEEKNITAEDLEDVYSIFDHVIFTSAKTGRNVEYLFKELASSVAYNIQLSVKDVEDIILTKELSDPKEFLDALLSISSNVGDMPYDVREDLLEESGINKFDLEENISSIEEEEVLRFANILTNWYDEESEERGERLLEKVLERYQG